jgi:hypothetical protein
MLAQKYQAYRLGDDLGINVFFLDMAMYAGVCALACAECTCTGLNIFS